MTTILISLAIIGCMLFIMHILAAFRVLFTVAARSIS